MAQSQKSYEQFAHFPDLVTSAASLVPLEKSLLAHFMLLNRPQLIVELGVYEAQTTIFMCRFLQANGIDCQIAGFDLPDVVEKLRQNNEAVQQFEFSGQLRLIPGRLPESLDDWLQAEKPAIDFALVDAMHDYPSAHGELERLWPYLRAGAYVLCHDYSEKYRGVRYAVDHFARSKGAHVLPLLTTLRARDAHYGSVLVALAKPAFPYRRREQFTYALQARMKALKRHLANSELWQKWLKPVLRRK
jgi:predicted O-methyltransferase YrrM